MSSNELTELPIRSLREPPTALRSAKRGTEDYLSLVESVRVSGVLTPILVRSSDEPGVYWVVDGCQRYNAALDAGLETVPVKLKEMSNEDALVTQIVTNAHRIETAPVEFCEQLHRILKAKPHLTIADLSRQLGKSYQWLSSLLNLTNLDPAIMPLANDGRIVLSNATALSKLPAEEQAPLVDQAMTMSPAQFVPIVNARAKEIADAKRQGRDVRERTFVAVPHLQKIGVIKEEIESGKVAAALLWDSPGITPAKAFALALQWALHLDPLSIEAQKKADEAQKRKVEDAKLARRLERHEQRVNRAAEAAAALSM